MKISISILTLLVFGFTSVSFTQELLISQEVRDNIKRRIENGFNPAIVVGLISSDTITYYSYGVKSLKTNDSVNPNTVFEIGSISKTFTGIVLADMALEGELSLNDPLQEFIPDSITAPTRNGDSIKLYQLSNHTSSLPRMPSNFAPANYENPYIDYTEEQLYSFLNEYKLQSDIGSEYEYSNYAVGLLGHILAKTNGTSYEDLILEVITKPLGLENTRIHLTPKMKENLALGHSNGVQVENWDLTCMAGAGAIRSTTVDMVNYISANMGRTKSDLYPAMQLSHKNSRKEGVTPIVGLGWHTMLIDDLEIVWHNGGTGGYKSFAGFVKGGDKGVVVLSNSNETLDDIGVHLLNPAYNLKTIRPSIGTHLKDIIDEKGMEKATKAYWELKENQPDTYNFDKNQLKILGYLYLRNEEIEKAKSVFKLNIEAFPDSYIVYDSYGEALMNNSEKQKAITNYKRSVEINPGNTNALIMLKKMGVDTENIVKEIVVDNEVLESYVGDYELVPGFEITVTKQGKQLKAKATGQPQYKIYPKSKNVFYFKAVEAQVTFNENENGEVESLTLLQNGQENVGVKVEE
jgi:CubicO group peptidase (beta-lactamase class C family)